jgi:ribosomal protein S18 acetylase RimI-like enzyme
VVKKEIILIIPAEPRHAEKACQLIHQSGPISFDYIFSAKHGPDVKRFINQAFQTERTMFSHRHHYVYQKNNQAVATLGLFTKTQHDKTFLDNAKWIWKHYGTRSILKGLAFELRLVKAPKKNCLYLCHIAVSPDDRGKGIAQQLINFAVQKAKELNIHTLSLDVTQDNNHALNLYLQLGFTKSKTNKSYNKLLDTHIYMEKLI